MKGEELKRALKFEAQKHIPFSIDEVNLDSYILKEDLSDNKMFVLLAAVKKELIEQRLKLIEQAGLKTNIIDMDSIALINAFNFNYPKEDKAGHNVMALLNIGAAMSNLNILEDGIPRLSRDISNAGNNFTQKIMDVFGLDFNLAENLKLNPDKERLDKASSAIEAALTVLATEIRISCDYYESQNVSSVSKIFVSGGSVLFTGLKEMLAELLGIEVEFWDPLKRINIQDTIDSGKVKALSSQLAVAVGLALRQ
jgi:type IV pilus assembly protein PilM